MHSVFAFKFLLALSALPTAVLATCSHDNCYRALARHSFEASSFCASYTAGDPLPDYAASACSENPSRVTSACSCVFTSTSTSTSSCKPSSIINEDFRNGNFDQTPYGPSETNLSEPPWFTTRATNVTVTYVKRGAGGSAVFSMIGQPYGQIGPLAQIKDPITVCQQTNYTISFSAYQSPSTANQACVLEIGWNDSNYGILGPNQIGDEAKRYGPIPFESTYLGPTPDNSDGTFNQELSVLVSCFGVQGKAPQDVQFHLWDIVVNPA